MFSGATYDRKRRGAGLLSVEEWVDRLTVYSDKSIDLTMLKHPATVTMYKSPRIQD